MVRILKYGLILLVAGLSACSVMQLSDPIGENQRARAEESFDTTTLTTSLEDILAWHQTNQTELATALKPGLERSVLQQKLAALPCQPTEELIQLWGWRNGSQNTAQPFIWYHNFLPVEEAITEYESLRANPLIGWRENWLPVFEFEGEWYFVECYDQPRAASPVGYFFLEDTEAVYAYTSLTKMLETSAAWFKQQAVTWDGEQQGMQEDLKQLFEIHQAHNQGARFPYHVE